ncbi:MAG: hypothetical protein OXD44_05030, partial [Gammaproteobacteria bacterium]|nr:hypothetical protein [Gammaproteobacteria bacterium]
MKQMVYAYAGTPSPLEEHPQAVSIMTVIKENDLVESVASALQYISYYHSRDFIQAMHRAWLREES